MKKNMKINSLSLAPSGGKVWQKIGPKQKLRDPLKSYKSIDTKNVAK